MKLYSFPASPYGIRVELLIALKKLDIEVTSAPWALKTPEFNARFPLGKVPVLVLDDEQHIGESWAILEYLEDTHPQGPALRPVDPMEKAHMQMLARYADTHLASDGVFPIFKTLLVPGTGTPDQMVPAMHDQLRKGNRLLEHLPSCKNRPMHLGDIALAPTLMYAEEMLKRYDNSGFSINDLDALAAWWDWFKADQVAADVIEAGRKAANALLDAFTR